MLFKVLEKLALELWGCFALLTYAFYLWTGHISWRVCAGIAAGLLAGALALSRVWAKTRRPRRPPPIRRAWLDDEGNLHWADD